MEMKTRLLLLTALSGLAAMAHFAWIELAGGLTKGQTAQIRIGFGADLAKSASAISLDGTTVFAIAPSGARSALAPQTEGPWLVASYAVKEAGAHRIYFTQDRGAMSQTTSGVKPGGRDAHPDAKRSFKSWRSGMVFGWTEKAKPTASKPQGLPLEIVAEKSADGHVITVYREGKPAVDAEVSVARPGVEEAQPAGRTDKSGRFAYKVPAGQKSAYLLLAAVAEPAPKGANYDTQNLTASVLLNW
jgi:uncharacterized GH25 family protein